MANTASATLVEGDKIVFGDKQPVMYRSFLKKSEPATTRLVRTACKALADGGNDKSGCYGLFMEYISPLLRRRDLTTYQLSFFFN